MKRKLGWLVFGLAAGLSASAQAEIETLKTTYSEAKGIGVEAGVMRRDPSDIIKVGDLYYVWYSKGTISPGYDATVWYATSTDGHQWTEKGMALAKGEPGSWEGASVFTPNILVAEGRYWLFYTGTSRKFGKGFNPDSKIGIAVSDSPAGPWERLATNPALKNSDKPEDFDSHLVDDACLIVRGGKYWFYYKGRQLGRSPGQTKMGVAIADRPQGPYVKYEGNPVIPGNHEVLVWPQGTGVAAMIGTTGPKEITRSIVYDEGGLDFSKTHNVLNVPTAAGAYRPEAFSESGEGERIEWGVHIGKQGGFLPFIQRFDLIEERARRIAPGLLSATNAGVTISAVGDGVDYDSSGTEVMSFRSPNVAKTRDVGGDNIYGSTGWFFFGQGGSENVYGQPFTRNTKNVPAWVTAIDQGANFGSVAEFGKYSSIDNPTLPPSANVADWSRSAIGFSTRGGAGSWSEIMTFTIDASAPTQFRVGIMAGNEGTSDGRWDPTGLRLSFSGGPAVEARGLPVMNSKTAGLVFFDVSTDGKGGGTFSIEGQQRVSGQGPSIAGVTFDVPGESLNLFESGNSVVAPDPMEASIRAKADRPWFAQFMVGEPVVAGFPGESKADRLKRVKPWAAAKFGLFLHWGPQRSGGEYIISPADLNKFNPVKFDAEEWVLTAKDLGFKYMVITTKHHAGFCMFDSAYTDHDIMDATPFGRDPMKELADACAKHGMLLGFYYSVWDIKHPDYTKNIGSPNYAKYQQYMLDQTTELLTKYGPIATLWMDGEWVNTWTYERASEYRDQVRKLQPNIMLVDRIGQRRLGDGDYGSSENFTPYIGDNINDRLWETCQRFDGLWFYTGRDNSQSMQWALRNLIDTVSRGGNLLLNMGPTPEGLLPPQSVKKLRPLGAWLRQYGEAVYDVQRGPHYLLEWGNCTRRGNTLYYFIADWPSDGTLVIPGLNEGKTNTGIKQISLLGESAGAAVSFRQAGRDVFVSLPDSPADPLMSVLKVELDGAPVVDHTIRPLGAPLRPQTGNPNVKVGDYFLSSAFANIHGDKLYFSLGTGAGAQRENLKGWTEESDWAQWEIAADKPGTYEVKINYSSWMNSGKFVVEVAGKTFEHTVVASKPPRKQSPLVAAFKTVTVGEVALATGAYKVAVKAVEIDPKAKEYNLGLMLLREVVLSVKD